MDTLINSAGRRPLQAGLPLRKKLSTLAWVLLVGGYLAVSLQYLTSPRNFHLTAFGDTMQCLAALFGCIALLATASSTSEPRIRAFWLLLSLGIGLWLVGQSLWTYIEVFQHQTVPNPFLGDIVLFLHPVPMLAALGLRPHREQTNIDIRQGYLDFTLLLFWWVYLYMYIVIPWQYVMLDLAAYGANYDRLEGVENLLVCAGFVLLAMGTRGRWRRVYSHLAGATFLFTAGVYITNVAIDQGRYFTGSLYDIPIVAGIVWTGNAALLGWGLTPEGTATRPASRSAAWAAGLSMAAVLSLPLMALWNLASHAPDPLKHFRAEVIDVFIFLMLLSIFRRRQLADADRTRLLQQSRRAFEDLQRLQGQMVQTEKLASLGRLAAGAAHEINNPLTGILNYADLLAEDPGANHATRSTAGKILELSRRIAGLIARLQNFARQTPVEKELLDVNQVVSKALRLNELNLRNKNIEMQTHLHAGLPGALGDANQLTQVFYHILTNAVDSMEAQGRGTLTLSTASDGERVVVKVSDTGPGISHPGLVFDPFFSTKPVGKGTGLGLSACYGILKEHGGTIECENAAERGAIFRVMLPIAPEPARAPAARPPARVEEEAAANPANCESDPSR
jgi:signal transduction histidine kinase